MPLSGISRFFWAAGLLGHLLLLGVLFGRKRAERFPLFTAFVCGNVFRTAMLFFARESGNDRTYFVAYLLGQWVDVVLQILVVYEVASQVFRPMNRWTSDTRRHLQFLIAGSFAVALALTALAGPGKGSWEFSAPVKGSFFSAALMSELFLGMLWLSATVGLPWRTHVARIAYGLGAFSLVEVLIGAGQNMNIVAFNPGVGAALTYARMATYLLCLVYWIATLWPDPPPDRKLPLATRKELEAIAQSLAYDVHTLRQRRKQ